MIHLEDEKKFNELIKDKAVVDFFATWCGPCKMLGPVFEEVSKEKDINFVKVDIDNFEDICREYKVMSVPTLILFENGKEVKRNVGFIPKEELIKFIENK